MEAHGIGKDGNPSPRQGCPAGFASPADASLRMGRGCCERAALRLPLRMSANLPPSVEFCSADDGAGGGRAARRCASGLPWRGEWPASETIAPRNT